MSLHRNMNDFSNDGARVIKTSNLSNASQLSIQNPKSATSNLESAVLRMKLINSNSKSQIFGLDELPGKINYFAGNNHKKWNTNIPTYGKVMYQDVYPGVDMIFYGNRRQLEYDLVVAPGANTRDIKLAFEGAGNITIDDHGDLVIQIKGTVVRQHKPVVYQDIDGVRKNISGRYALDQESQSIGFQVAAYDPESQLIIDPVISYSSLVGGGFDTGLDIAVDSSGSAYIMGQTFSDNFPTTSGALRDAPIEGKTTVDAFVTKLNPSGSGLVYSTFLGGGATELDGSVVGGIAVDQSGNAYITGATWSDDFPIKNAFQPENASAVANTLGLGGDAFVAKLNPTGSALVYSTYLGGKSADAGHDIAVDSFGNAYVTGATGSDDFPTINAIDPICGNGAGCPPTDVFVTKFTASGEIAYSTFLGADLIDQGNGIAVDSGGHVYVTGTISGDKDDFPFTKIFPLDPDTSFIDPFVIKINSLGSAMVYATLLGGNEIEDSYDIAVDAAGNAYVTGITRSEDFPVSNAFQAEYGGGGQGGDAFVSKLGPGGDTLIYSTFLGGSNLDWGLNIAVDAKNNAYVTGRTDSDDFPLKAPFQLEKENSSDAFVTKFNSNGAMVYSSYLGGLGFDQGNGIAADAAGNAYVTGNAGSPFDFPIVNQIPEVDPGGENAFVTKISDTTSTPIPTQTPKPTTDEECSNVKITNSIPAFNAPSGVFFSNTVEVTIPEIFSTVIFSTDPDGQAPFGMDDWAIVTVTGPSGSEQSAILNENDAFGNPIGEQFILSNVVILEPGINKIKVELWNEFAPAGTNASSSTIWIVPLDQNGKAICEETITDDTILFSEDFEAYTPGSNLAGQGGWTGDEIRVGNGAFLDTNVLNGRDDIGIKIQSNVSHSLSRSLNSSEITKLTFDAWATSNFPLTHNMVVGFGNTQDSIYPDVFWYPAENSSSLPRSWTFLARALTGNADHRFDISGGYNQAVTLSIVVNGAANEIFGIYDFGAGPKETPHFNITPEQIKSLNTVAISADFRAPTTSTPLGSQYIGGEFDNILVTTTSLDITPTPTPHPEPTPTPILTPTPTPEIPTPTPTPVTPGEVPAADFVVNTTSGPAPLTVVFTDVSSGDPTSWRWSFGDGAESIEQNPTHQYNNEGKFTVTLTVSNNSGTDSLTKKDLINVTKGKKSCAASAALDSKSSLAALRMFRDKVMSKTSAGLKLISLYYRYSNEVEEILDADPALKSKASNILNNLAGALRSNVDKESVNQVVNGTISGSLVSEVNGLLDDISERGSSELKAAIRDAGALVYEK